MKVLKRFLKNKVVELWEMNFFQGLFIAVVAIFTMYWMRYISLFHGGLDYNKTSDNCLGWFLVFFALISIIGILAIIIKFTIIIIDSIKYDFIPWIKRNWRQAKEEIAREEKSSKGDIK